MTTLVLVETVLLAVLTVLVAGLLRAYGSVLARLHRLDGGGTEASTAPASTGARTFALQPVAEAATPAPARDVSGSSAAGEVIHVRVAGVEHDTVLLFLSTGCASCASFWRDLRRPVPLPPRTRLLVVTQGEPDELLPEVARVAPAGLDVVLSTQTWRDYEVPGSPHVVLVSGPSGRIRGEGTGQSLEQICRLLARATGDPGYLPGSAPPKSPRDRRDEADVDRELLAAGILPGDPRLYGEQP